MKAAYLIAYDITSPKRLNRVARYLKQEGIRIQYSVFWATLTWPQLARVKANLSRLIDEERDDVRIYPLPAQPRVTVMGRSRPFPAGVQVFFERSSSGWILRKGGEGSEGIDKSEKERGDLKEH